MKPDKVSNESTFISPFTLEVALPRLKNAVKRGVYLNYEKLDADHIAFWMSMRYGIGVVEGCLSRDGNHTSVTYTMRWTLSGLLKFAMGNAYPILVFTAGVPMTLAFGIQALVSNQPLEAVLLLGAMLVMVWWLGSAWRAAFKQKNLIAQILFYTLHDPIPDIPDLSRS